MNSKFLLFILTFAFVVGCKTKQTKMTEDKNQSNAHVQKQGFDTQITEKYWKLVKLGGMEIKMDKNQEQEVYFMLKEKENRVRGFAGCNNFSGEYLLEEGNRIRFSHMAVTQKACLDVTLNETEFLKVFELADNYTINDDVLFLNVGRRAPLAVFEAVYFN